MGRIFGASWPIPPGTKAGRRQEDGPELLIPFSSTERIGNRGGGVDIGPDRSGARVVAPDADVSRIAKDLTVLGAVLGLTSRVRDPVEMRPIGATGIGHDVEFAGEVARASNVAQGPGGRRRAVLHDEGRIECVQEPIAGSCAIAEPAWLNLQQPLDLRPLLPEPRVRRGRAMSARPPVRVGVVDVERLHHHRDPSSERGVVEQLLGDASRDVRS